MFISRKGPMIAVSAAVIWMTGIAGAVELPQELVACRALLTAEARLSCYDRVTDEVAPPAGSNITSRQVESQPKTSQSEAASRTEAPADEYGRVIDEVAASAGSNISSDPSNLDPPASQAETASRVEPCTPDTASGEKQAETIATAEGSQSPEALFGMSAQEQLVVVRKEAPSETVERIEARISELRHSRTGKAVITLDNGHIWQQIDSQKLRLSEHDRVLVRRASLGSFLLKKMGAKKSMRVKRIR